MTSHPSLDSTPPSELFRQWEDDILNERENVDVVLDTVYRAGFIAGADAELEACVEWMGDSPVVWRGDPEEHPGFYLREARRPKPPSLADQALEQLRGIETCVLAMHGGRLIDDVIHAALKRLKELEDKQQ